MRSVINQMDAPARDCMFPLSDKVHYSIRNIIDYQIWAQVSMVPARTIVYNHLFGITNNDSSIR